MSDCTVKKIRVDADHHQNCEEIWRCAGDCITHKCTLKRCWCDIPISLDAAMERLEKIKSGEIEVFKSSLYNRIYFFIKNNPGHTKHRIARVTASTGYNAIINRLLANDKIYIEEELYYANI